MEAETRVRDHQILAECPNTNCGYINQHGNTKKSPSRTRHHNCSACWTEYTFRPSESSIFSKKSPFNYRYKNRHRIHQPR